MPWTGQACPFCDTKYANKRGLQNHLLSYTGRWRIPADGIHDVLKIQNLTILKDHFDADNTIFYRCPSCAMKINDLRRFEEHVFYRQHYGDDYNKDIDEKSQRGWTSFDPELHKIHVWRPNGPFTFLRLPLELREMIYKTLICFDKIEFDTDFHKHSVDPVKGVWLQHNPSANLLALLAVSRQVYDEARRVFYAYNSFVFHEKGPLCVFLFGIGSHNASLLRSVKWENDNGQFQNHIDMIKPYITQHENAAQKPQLKKKKLNIWNDDNQYVEFLQIIKSPGPDEWGCANRLLRRDSEDVLPTDYFHRYTFTISCWEGKELRGKVNAAYELCSREVKNDDPVWEAAFRALKEEAYLKRRDRARKRRRR